MPYCQNMISILAQKIIEISIFSCMFTIAWIKSRTAVLNPDLARILDSDLFTIPYSDLFTVLEQQLS